MKKEAGAYLASVMEMERPLFGQLIRQVVSLRSDQLEACVAIQRQAGGSVELGQVMIEQGLITQDHIRRVLELQASWTAKALTGDVSPLTLPYPTFFSLCLPAYNEAANIEDTVDGACAVLPEFVKKFEVVVVDDGSRDDTARIVEKYSERDPRVRLVRHEQNRGYGAAVTTGMRAARGDLIMFTDADGQFSLLDLPYLLAQLDQNDLVIGYRYKRADPWHRKVNAWAWNRLIRFILGVKVNDLDCAFKIFRREIVEQLQMTATGAAINAEIMAQCFRSKLKIAQVPVAHYPRFKGTPTGAAFRVILKAFRELPRLWKYRSCPIIEVRNLGETPVPHERSKTLPDATPAEFGFAPPTNMPEPQGVAP